MRERWFGRLARHGDSRRVGLDLRGEPQPRRSAAAAVSDLAKWACAGRKPERRVAMPGKKTQIPDTIERSPKKAERTWKKAHDSAVETYGEGGRAERHGQELRRRRRRGEHA